MRHNNPAAVSAGRPCGRNRGTHRRLGFPLIAVLALLIFAACGSDDDAAEPATQAPSVPPPSESIAGSAESEAPDRRARQARERREARREARRERDRREARAERRRGSDRPDPGDSSAGAQEEARSERGTEADVVWRGKLFGRNVEISRVSPGSEQCEITHSGQGAGDENKGRFPCERVREFLGP